MNISKDKIDQLFSEKLEAFEVKPRAHAWDKLENKINKKNKNRAFGWYKFAIAASIALLVFVGGLSYFNSSEPINTDSKLATNKSKVTDNESVTSQVYTSTNSKKDYSKKENNLPKTYKNSAKNFFENKKTNQELPTDFIAKIEINEGIKPIQTIEVLAENIPTKIETTIEEPLKKEEDLTILFTVANFEKPTINETVDNENINKEKKSKYLTKLYKQLINAKNGDRVDWNEVGFKPVKVFARAESKLKLTKNEINDSYQTAKNKTVF